MDVKLAGTMAALKERTKVAPMELSSWAGQKASLMAQMMVFSMVD